MKEQKREPEIFSLHLQFTLFKQRAQFSRNLKFLASCSIKCCKIRFFPTLPEKIVLFISYALAVPTVQNIKNPLFGKLMLRLLRVYYGIMTFFSFLPHGVATLSIPKHLN